MWLQKSQLHKVGPAVVVVGKEANIKAVELGMENRVVTQDIKKVNFQELIDD